MTAKHHSSCIHGLPTPRTRTLNHGLNAVRDIATGGILGLVARNLDHVRIACASHINSNMIASTGAQGADRALLLH